MTDRNGNSGVIRIATFNMESLDEPPRGRASLDDRIRALRPQLQRLRADVLCLQEVNGQPDATGGPRTLAALERVIKDTAYERYHMVATQSPSGRGVRDRHNLVILSRYPIAGSDQVLNHLIDPPLYRAKTSDPAAEAPQPVEWDRPMLYADLDLGDGIKMVVINVHLRAPRAAFVPGQKTDRHNWKTMTGWAEGFFLATVKAAGQALEVRAFLDRLFDLDSDALVAVVGDFNCSDGQAPARIVLGDEDDVGRGELSGRMLMAAERALPESQRYSVIHRGRPHMADHIFLSRALMGWLGRVECHNEGLHDEVSSPQAVPDSPESYHAPLVCELVRPA